MSFTHSSSNVFRQMRSHQISRGWLFAGAAVLGLAGAAQATPITLYDSEGFENHPTGELVSGDGWTVGVASPRPQIVSLGEENGGNVLEIYRPRTPGNSNNRVDFASQHEGFIDIKFDFRTNTNFRSITVALTPEEASPTYFDRTSVSFTWGRQAGLIEHYNGTGWQTIGSFAINTWQNVNVRVYLDGDNAGTFDFTIDGGEPVTNIPWRVDLDLTDEYGLSQLWFQGTGAGEEQGGGDTSRWGQVDNLQVVWVPEPGSMSLFAAGLCWVLRRRR